MGADGTLLTLNELLNSDKALTMILAIFLSVAVAFVFGFLVQWLSRLLFTFTYNKNSQLKVGIFAGIAITCILWFLLIKGLKGSTLQTPELMEFLMSTGDAIIVEASPYDKIWGIGLDMETAKAGNVNDWKGENLLGCALMETRDWLREK